METRSFHGPMVTLTWVVTAGWVLLGVVAGLTLDASWRWVFVVLGTVGALLTGWIGTTMRVRGDEDGVRVSGRHVPWEAVDSLELRPGPVTVPVLNLRVGRGLDQVVLDGMAWFGGPDGTPRRLADQLADVAGCPVTVRGARSTGPGRRGIA